MELAQLIAATESTDGNIRAPAEAQLMEARNKNPGLFILACAHEFSESNLPDKLRPKAGILIKYTLLGFQEGEGKLWTSLDQETRERSKTKILGTLAYRNDPIRKVAADLIAIIYGIEFQLGQWTELIPALVNNTNNQDPEIKKSAILTLGKLCDHFKTKKIEMSADISNQILSGIYYGMQANETDDIKIIAVKALGDSLLFVRELFDKANVRQEVVKLLLDLVASNNRDVKTNAMECLIEFVKIYYDYLEELYGAVWEYTGTLINANDMQLSILAIEIWNTIANEDKERSNNASAYEKKYIGVTDKVSDVLVPPLLSNLLDARKYGDNDDGGQYNIVSSTKNCLISIAEVTKDKFLNYVVNFVGTYLLSQQNIELRAGLIAYSCMLDGPSKQSLAGLLNTALPTITKILEASNNLHVRQAAAAALERTAEFIPDVFFQENLFVQILPTITAAIDLHPEISLHITRMWHFLGEEVIRRQRHNPNFAVDFSQVIELLIKNAFKPLDKEHYILIDHSLLSVMTLLLCTTDNNTSGKYVAALVEQFKKTAEVGGERRELIQGGLLACLQTLLHKYQLPPANGVHPLVDEIFNLIIQMFQAYKEVTADGIYVLGALASASGSDFQVYSTQIWPFIAEGFKRYDQPELFLATLNAIVELAGACPEQTVGYLGDIFNTLITLLDEKAYDKSLKLRIIMTIGDISLGCKDLILPYVSNLIRMYEMAMNAGVTLPTNESAEIAEYLEQLRENVLSSYVCFFHAVTESKNPESILESIPKVMNFLATTCTEAYNPTVDYMRDALALMADLGLIFKEKAAQYVKSDLTFSLMKVLEKFQNNPDNLQILKYAQKIIDQLPN